jgi:Spy/CpxP family protein refolding chaperone
MSPERRFKEAIENIVEPTAEQRKQLTQIFEEHAQKMAKIQEEKESELFNVVDSLRLALNTILTEDQIKRFHKHMDQTRDRFMIMHLDRLQRAVDLTEEQYQKIKEIFEKYQQFLPDKYPARRMGPPKPEMREMLRKLDKEIEAVLTPEQVEKYQKHKMERGRGPGKFFFRGDHRRMDRNRRLEYFY